MWGMIKQTMQALRLERALGLVVLLSGVETFAFFTQASAVLLVSNFALLVTLMVLTLVVMIDDMRGMKNYFVELQGSRNLEWQVYVNGFLSPLRMPLHDLMKPYWRHLASNQDVLKEMAFSSAELAGNAREFCGECNRSGCCCQFKFCRYYRNELQP